jgi:cyclophilin family peptidyl-prolyl cis-trans isomerase
VEGMDVVDAISQVATNKANNDRPLQNVKIVKAQVLP